MCGFCFECAIREKESLPASEPSEPPMVSNRGSCNLTQATRVSGANLNRFLLHPEERNGQASVMLFQERCSRMQMTDD